MKSSCLLHLSLLGFTPSERQGFSLMAMRRNAQEGEISAFPGVMQPRVPGSALGDIVVAASHIRL